MEELRWSSIFTYQMYALNCWCMHLTWCEWHSSKLWLPMSIPFKLWLKALNMYHCICTEINRQICCQNLEDFFESCSYELGISTRVLKSAFHIMHVYQIIHQSRKKYAKTAPCAARGQQFSLKKTVSSSLSPIPLTPATADGLPVKTDNAKLLWQFQKIKAAKFGQHCWRKCSFLKCVGCY